MALKTQVERFYQEIWDRHDFTHINEILHEDFSFRGSLGPSMHGQIAFRQYVDRVHQSLQDYRCIIEVLVEEGDRVFARMLFRGIHRDSFLGFAPTGKPVSWAGSALFTFDLNRVRDLWVLGDLKALESQLRANRDR